MKRILVLAALSSLAACAALGQTTAPVTPAAPAAATCSPLGLSVSSDAVAVQDPTGTWTVGSVDKQGYDFLDFGAGKCNRIFAEGTQGLMPQANANFYGGGFAVQPNIANLFKNTNLPTGNFNLFFDGGAGILQVTSTSTKSSVGGYFGAALKENFGTTLTWNTFRAEIFVSGGKVYKTLSTGITKYF